MIIISIANSQQLNTLKDYNIPYQVVHPNNVRILLDDEYTIPENHSLIMLPLNDFMIEDIIRVMHDKKKLKSKDHKPGRQKINISVSRRSD